MKVKCVECDRVFDLLNETDAEEWGYGHDCEPSAERTEEATHMYDECLAAYESGGQYAVYKLVRERYPSTPWLWCDACAEISPVDADDLACLVCGSYTGAVEEE